MDRFLSKFSSFILIISLTASAKSLNYGVLNDHSFLIEKGVVNLEGSYLRVNDDLDIFNMRDSELGSLAKYGDSIGNLGGYQFEFSLGTTENSNLFFNFEEWNIDYGGSNLKNSKFEIFGRYNLLQNKYAIINSLSLDLGGVFNSAKRVDLSNIGMMNSMIAKIYPNGDYSISDSGAILKDGSETTFYDLSGNLQKPVVSIDDLSSSEIYLKMLFGKIVGDKTILDLFISYSYINIGTEVEVSPSELISKISIPDLNRDEHVISAGFSLISEFKYLLFEFSYIYSRIFREEGLRYIDYSNNVEMILSLPLSKNFLVFTGGEIMFQQFNRDLPYLYNRYTETQFDKKYGFAKFGLIYKFKGF
jgi:hypothetical protein